MQYRYSGPMTAMTLHDGREVILFPDAIVELPEEADVTQTLIDLGRLQAASQADSVMIPA